MDTGGGGGASNSLWSFEMSDEHAADDEDTTFAILNRSGGNGKRGGAAVSEYDFATHVVKVKRSGQVVDVSSLWDDVEGNFFCSLNASLH